MPDAPRHPNVPALVVTGAGTTCTVLGMGAAATGARPLGDRVPMFVFFLGLSIAGVAILVALLFPRRARILTTAGLTFALFSAGCSLISGGVFALLEQRPDDSGNPLLDGLGAVLLGGALAALALVAGIALLGDAVINRDHDRAVPSEPTDPPDADE